MNSLGISDRTEAQKSCYATRVLTHRGSFTGLYYTGFEDERDVRATFTRVVDMSLLHRVGGLNFNDRAPYFIQQEFHLLIYYDFARFVPNTRENTIFFFSQLPPIQTIRPR